RSSRAPDPRRVRTGTRPPRHRCCAPAAVRAYCCRDPRSRTRALGRSKGSQRDATRRPTRRQETRGQRRLPPRAVAGARTPAAPRGRSAAPCGGPKDVSAGRSRARRSLMSCLVPRGEQSMPSYLSPGVYVEEVASGTRPIEGVGTSVAAFVGLAPSGPLNEPTLVTNWSQYVAAFGDFTEGYYPAHSVHGFTSE